MTEKKIFISGHFRLNESKSARDWINLERLFSLERSEFIDPVVEAIYNEITKNYQEKEGITLIGFNYYGAILASFIGYKYSIPFTYCFKDDSTVDEIENELHDIESRQLIIISDVMVFGKTISKFVDNLCERNVINSETNIDLFVLFERKVDTDYIAYTYLQPMIKRIFILNDSFDIEICRKDRNKCLFVQNKDLCQEKNFCY